jgi:hypothetical protein
MINKKMHVDEVDTDVSLVRRLLTTQFPQWTNLPINTPKGTAPLPQAGCRGIGKILFTKYAEGETPPFINLCNFAQQIKGGSRIIFIYIKVYLESEYTFLPFQDLRHPWKKQSIQFSKILVFYKTGCSVLEIRMRFNLLVTVLKLLFT